jgi:hypothetical protein
VNDVGEPCAGEPHARFDRGPLAKRDESEWKDEEPSGQRLTRRMNDQPAAYLTTRSPPGLGRVGLAQPRMDAAAHDGGFGRHLADLAMSSSASQRHPGRRFTGSFETASRAKLRVTFVPDDGFHEHPHHRRDMP